MTNEIKGYVLMSMLTVTAIALGLSASSFVAYANQADDLAILRGEVEKNAALSQMMALQVNHYMDITDTSLTDVKHKLGVIEREVEVIKHGYSFNTSFITVASAKPKIYTEKEIAEMKRRHQKQIEEYREIGEILDRTGGDIEGLEKKIKLEKNKNQI